MLTACDTLSLAGYKLLWGPGRHGIGHNLFTYHRAPNGLITELFADSETGAINYGTTDQLLQHLGINSIDELPPISPLLDDGADGFEE
jgi:hypothetical protein